MVMIYTDALPMGTIHPAAKASGLSLSLDPIPVIIYMEGVYVLILRLDADKDIGIGKLGKFSFRKGFYAYVGSAHGQGGFKRVTRHFDVACGKNSTRKWHIDYLLLNSKITAALLFPTRQDIECDIAHALCEFPGIPGFGCSDCTCETHLFYSDTDPKNKVIHNCNKFAGNESIIINPHI